MMVTVALTLSQVAAAVDIPVVYNHVSGAPSPLDLEVHERLGKRYRVVDFTDREHSWAFPKGIAGFTPHPPVYVDNRCVAGSALVVYVIALDGSVVDAFSVKSTSDLLAQLGLKSMSEKRFTPGQLDGRSVASVAASNVQFRCPAEGK
jgi:hypothetical protein